MPVEDKLNLIISQLAELQKQVTLIQAVLLELTSAPGRAVGRESTGKTGQDCYTSGCEDQCKEPQG